MLEQNLVLPYNRILSEIKTISSVRIDESCSQNYDLTNSIFRKELEAPLQFRSAGRINLERSAIDGLDGRKVLEDFAKLRKVMATLRELDLTPVPSSLSFLLGSKEISHDLFPYSLLVVAKLVYDLPVGEMRFKHPSMSRASEEFEGVEERAVSYDRITIGYRVEKRDIFSEFSTSSIRE